VSKLFFVAACVVFGASAVLAVGLLAIGLGLSPSVSLEAREPVITREYGSGPSDAGQCHRQCRVILPQDDAGEYSYRCGPCLMFCTETRGETPTIIALPQSDAGCPVWDSGTWR